MKGWIKFLSVLACLSSLSALDIDVASLEKIVTEHPDALNERLILARYYLKKGNIPKAETMVQSVLRKEPNNDEAIKIQRDIQKSENLRQTLKKVGLEYPIDSKKAQEILQKEYEEKNYRRYIYLYRAFVDSKIELKDRYHIDAAYIYLWNGSYKQARDALDRVRRKNDYDAVKIEAQICYYEGDYACAAKYLEKIFQAEESLQSAKKLIESYLKLGDVSKAEQIYRYVKRKKPNDSTIRGLGQKIEKSRSSRLQKLRKSYETSPTLKNLEPYLNALFDMGKTDDALNTIHEYNQKRPTRDSLLLEAKYLSWHDHNEKASKILKNDLLKNDLEAMLLLGKIESWRQHFGPAEKYLQNILKHSRDPKLRYETRKALAFVKMWRGSEKEAKRDFEALRKERPKDKEVREALMRLNHDYKGLIEIYKHRDTAEAAKKLGDLYRLDHRPKEAIRQWQTYLKAHPDDLETLKKIALAQIEQKNYYHGFGNLEYYASKKQSPDAYLLLAKQYYWHGFFKEALSVLDDLLKQNPDYEDALKLKGEILKVSPRFTISNSGATTKMFWDDVTKKELFLADTLYFNGHYKAALDYYRSYLHIHPSDHKVRYRYAIALENAALYGKAEGEFSLAKWGLDSDELDYHYAYNLMKNGKLEKARNILERLKDRTYRKISPQLATFLNEWKKAWESMNFEKYRTFYAPVITQDERWALHKQALFSHLKHISVSIIDPVYKPLGEHRYLVHFYQTYSSDKHSDKGYKTLLLKCEDGMHECRIVKEQWRRASYKKFVPLLPYVEKALRELEMMQSRPQAMLTNKKKREISTAKPYKKRDVYLAPGLHEDLLNKQEVFDTIVATPEPVKKVGPVYAKNMGASKRVPSRRNRGNVKGYHYLDSDDFSFDSIDLFYTRLEMAESVDWGMDAGMIRLAQKSVVHHGYRLGTTVRYDAFSFRIGIDRFEDFTDWVPTIGYRFYYPPNHVSVEYTRRNALFYTYNMTPYNKKIMADHLAISDYAAFENGTSLWASIGFNRFGNGDFEINPQFDWIFYDSESKDGTFHWDMAMEGWYTSHSKPNHGDFYSPGFTDSTLLRLDADYTLTPLLKLKGSVGAGYSFHDENAPYKYGLWLSGASKESLRYKVGCLRSNVARIAAGPAGYHYIECRADLGYQW